MEAGCIIKPGGHFGAVKDLSLTGIGLCDLPSSIMQKKQPAIIILDRMQSICCEVIVSPCWTSRGLEIDAGANSAGWNEGWKWFVRKIAMTAGKIKMDAGFSIVGRGEMWKEFVKKVKIKDEREGKRKRLKECIVIIECGNLSYGGTAVNVSPDGIQVDELPSGFIVKGQRYSICIVDTKEQQRFTLKTSVCWQKEENFLADAGFRILERDAAWQNFVQQIDNEECERRLTERSKPEKCLYVFYDC